MLKKVRLRKLFITMARLKNVGDKEKDNRLNGVTRDKNITR